LDPVLDACATHYKELDPNAQIEFKGSAKAFVRTYGFFFCGAALWECRTDGKPFDEDLRM
jgi:hypothetical protein